MDAGQKDVDAKSLAARLDGLVAQRGADGCATLHLGLPDGWQVQVDDDAPCADGLARLAPAPHVWRRVRVLCAGACVAEGRAAAGEVFVVAGQSNAANWGEERLVCGDGRVRAFDGLRWSAAHDPLPGVQDGSAGGSPWPVCGAILARELGCAVGFASCGYGGTSIRAWQPDATHVQDGREHRLFETFVERARALHGLRGVLWHQGEADADVGMGRDEYMELHARLRAAFERGLGRPARWWVARATYVPGRAPATLAGVRAAQERMAAAGAVHAGPDTDGLLGALRHSRDGIHFSRSGLVAHGEAWARAILAALGGGSAPASTA